MKSIVLLFLFIPVISNAFTFEIINTSIGLTNSIVLGSVDIRLCNSSTLTPMNQLSDGVTDAICIPTKLSNSCKIDLIIPLKIKMTSAEAYDVLISKASAVTNFEKFSLRNIKDQAVGGGSELLGQSTLMNNQTVDGELEITAQVCGSGTSSSYSNEILIDITPAI